MEFTTKGNFKCPWVSCPKPPLLDTFFYWQHDLKLPHGCDNEHLSTVPSLTLCGPRWKITDQDPVSRFYMDYNHCGWTVPSSIKRGMKDAESGEMSTSHISVTWMDSWILQEPKWWGVCVWWRSYYQTLDNKNAIHDPWKVEPRDGHVNKTRSNCWTLKLY